jgi:acetyltransferase-like isoleucine patch superfamily enzyme
MNPGNGRFAGPPRERFFAGIKNRVLQLLARIVPGYSTLRVALHRWRGVLIGDDVSIGYDVILETAHPEWISIGNNVQVGMRATFIAHMNQMRHLPWEARDRQFVSIKIEDEVHLGPGVIILPRVTIGRGAVVAAGSVVSRNVPPMTFVQGNPAKLVARCGIPLLADTDWSDFVCKLRPVRPEVSSQTVPSVEVEVPQQTSPDPRVAVGETLVK